MRRMIDVLVWYLSLVCTVRDLEKHHLGLGLGLPSIELIRELYGR